MWGALVGRPGRGRVCLFAPQLPPLPALLLDGAREGRRRAGNHRGCHRSHFLPHTRKGEGLTASSQVGVGAGQDGGQLCLGGWISPSMLPCHTLGTHSAFSQGMRGEAMINSGEEERQSYPTRIRRGNKHPKGGGGGTKKKFCASSLRLREPK